MISVFFSVRNIIKIRSAHFCETWLHHHPRSLGSISSHIQKLQRWNLFRRMWTWAKLTSDALLFLGDISNYIPGTQNKQFKDVYFGDFQPCRELFHHLNQPLINVWSSQVRSNQSQKIWQSINVNGTLPSSLGKHKKLPFFKATVRGWF